MSPTRRMLLKASAGVVAAALAGTTGVRDAAAAQVHSAEPESIERLTPTSITVDLSGGGYAHILLARTDTKDIARIIIQRPGMESQVHDFDDTGAASGMIDYMEMSAGSILSLFRETLGIDIRLPTDAGSPL